MHSEPKRLAAVEDLTLLAALAGAALRSARRRRMEEAMTWGFISELPITPDE